MKNEAVIVLKKELSRFFGDKRLLFTSVIMPGLIIYLVYTLMGNAMGTMMNDKTSSPKIAAYNMPSVVSQMLLEDDFEIEAVDKSDIESVKKSITDGEFTLYVAFPDNFEDVFASYGTAAAIKEVPNVEIYYNSADIGSAHSYAQVITVLDTLEKSISNVFDINNTDEEEFPYDLATKEEASGTVLSMILPLLLMTLMFSATAALAPESIAGEKERGTIAALLITPVPRSRIILGKVIALSFMALLSGLSSFLGTFLSIPKLMENMGDEAETITTNVYGVKEYIYLMLLIMSTVMLFVTVISIVSTLAKSVKEAGTMVMPLQIVVMILALSCMYQAEPKKEIWWFLIPVYNSILSMSEVFSFSVIPVNIAAAVCANIFFSAAGIFVLTKLFDNEKVMFNY